MHAPGDGVPADRAPREGGDAVDPARPAVGSVGTLLLTIEVGRFQATAAAPPRAHAPELDLEILCAQLQHEVYSFALRSVRNEAVAEDLVAETFARLVGDVRRGRTPDDARAWVYRVLANLIVTRARRAAVADRWKAIVARRDEPERSPEATAIRRERRDAVQTALDELGPDARTALLLAARGFSGREIGAAIGRTDAATRTLLCRARATLRGRLEPPDDT